MKNLEELAKRFASRAAEIRGMVWDVGGEIVEDYETAIEALNLLKSLKILFAKNKLGLTHQFDDEGRYAECPCCFEFLEIEHNDDDYANRNMGEVKHSKTCELWKIYEKLK